MSSLRSMKRFETGPEKGTADPIDNVADECIYFSPSSVKRNSADRTRELHRARVVRAPCISGSSAGCRGGGQTRRASERVPTCANKHFYMGCSSGLPLVRDDISRSHKKKGNSAQQMHGSWSVGQMNEAKYQKHCDGRKRQEGHARNVNLAQQYRSPFDFCLGPFPNL